MSGIKDSPPCFDGLEKGQYYSKLPNMLQYNPILQKNLHGDMIVVQDEVQLFQSGDIEHGQDVSIGRNYHLVPGPKEPFTIHLGFRVII